MSLAVCLPIILEVEGGFVNNSLDPGGATNLGITKATLGQFLNRTATIEEVKALTPEDVAPIYEQLYWKPSGASVCAYGLDLMVFDMAVNMGVGRAVLTLQAALGVRADGALGPRTTQAIQATSPTLAISAISAAREALYRSFHTFPTFGVGWLSRLAKITTLSLGMVTP